LAWWAEKPIKPTSGTAQWARLPPNDRLGQSEVDTSGRQTYGFNVEIKVKSEIPANLFLGQDYLERIRVLIMADLNDPRRKGAITETSVQMQR
jgi:hypothetical protein